MPQFARYVVVFTTFPGAQFPAAVLERYRLRSQSELVFKRFPSLAQLGHLPKQNDDTAKAWLYGKLLLGPLPEKLIDHAIAISLWAYAWQLSWARRIANSGKPVTTGRCYALFGNHSRGVRLCGNRFYWHGPG